MMAIIGVLVALLLPAVQAARESARRTGCLNNLKQISLASINLHDVSGTLPLSPSADNRNQDDAGRRSWVVSILPYVEAQAIHDEMDFAIQGNRGVNLRLIQQYLASVLCPSDSEAAVPHVTELSRAVWTGTGDQDVALISYAGNSGDHRHSTGVGAPSPPYLAWANDAYDANSLGGVIGRWNYSASFREVTDGTSYTFAQLPIWLLGVARLVFWLRPHAA